MSANDDLGVYLNDHLAGPAFAMAAARHCRDHTEDTRLASYLSRFLDELREERSVLVRVIGVLGSSPDLAKSVVAWVAEKGTRLKLLRPPGRYTPLTQLEQLELLRLGVQGKQSLWNLLGAVARVDPRLRGIDFEALAQQAASQIATLEEHRLASGLQVAVPDAADAAAGRVHEATAAR